MIGLTSSTLKGTRRFLQRRSKFARKLAKCSLGGEVCAPGEMADNMMLLIDVFGLFEVVNPGLAGLGDCESLFTNLKTRKMVAGKYLVCRSPSIQQPLEEGGLERGRIPLMASPRCGATRLHCCDSWNRAVLSRDTCDPCGELEFIAHAHIQVGTEATWEGRRCGIA